MPVASMPAPGTPRRQARVLHQAVILPRGIDPHHWYDVVEGRRRDDTRPGMILLRIGGEMMHMPQSCLEFRSQQAVGARAADRVPASLPATWPAGRPAKLPAARAVPQPLTQVAALRAGALRAVADWGRGFTPRQIALAASIVPVGIVAFGMARRVIAIR
jgi:hypothetical protein